MTISTLKQRIEEWSVPEPNSGCWIWLGTVNSKGRAKLKVNGMTSYASRAVWQDHNGDIPPGLNVLHHCDNPYCVNLDHLFLGTQQDNVDDMIRKGRFRSAKADRTKCVNGHEYTIENTYRYKGVRICRECRKLYDRKRNPYR